MEPILDYDQDLRNYAVKIEAALDMWCDLIDEQSALALDIKGYCLDYLAEEPKCKAAMEKVEALAVAGDAPKTLRYKEYTDNKLLADKLKFRIEVLRDLHGGVRSQMKNNPPLGSETFGRGK